MIVVAVAFLSYFLQFWGVSAQVGGTQTFWPQAIPLAVHTPYLNAWMYTPYNAPINTTDSWPSFWSHNVCYQEFNRDDAFILETLSPDSRLDLLNSGGQLE